MSFRLQSHHFQRAEQALYAWGEHVRIAWAAPNSLQSSSIYRESGDLARLENREIERIIQAMDKLKNKYPESFELCRIIYVDGAAIPRQALKAVNRLLRRIQGWIYKTVWAEEYALQSGKRKMICSRDWRNLKMTSDVRVIVYEK